MANRIVFLDNVKGILIFLVVLGHIINPIHNDNPTLEVLFEGIYLFHMPLFVFVTGLFAKSVYKNGHLRANKVFSTLLLAFLFQLTITLIEEPDASLTDTLLVFKSAPWYLLALSYYYLLTPFFAETKPIVGIIGSFLIALGVGCFDELKGDFLALPRALTFLPFFVLGFYCTKENIQKLRDSIFAKGCAIATIVFFIWFAFFGNAIEDLIYLTYGTYAYNTRDLIGIGQHLVIFMLAIVISIGVMQLAPSKPLFLSTWGERTLQIYILHRIIKGVLDVAGFFALPILLDPIFGTGILLMLSLALTATLSIKPLKYPFDFIMNREWNKLFVKN